MPNYTVLSPSTTPTEAQLQDMGKRLVELKLADESTSVTTGDGKLIWMVPSEFNGYNLLSVAAGVTTVATAGVTTFQIRNVTQAADMLSTALSIDANESTSYTAATAAVIDTNNDDVASGDMIAIDKDAAGTTAKGDVILLGFRLP